MNQATKRCMLFCEPCSYKGIFESEESIDLHEIKQSNVPGGAPTFETASQKTVSRPVLVRARKFKCPKCGRGVTLKQLQGAYSKSYTEKEARDIRLQQEADKQKRLDDGKPLVRKDEEEVEFSG